MARVTFDMAVINQLNDEDMLVSITAEVGTMVNPYGTGDHWHVLYEVDIVAIWPPHDLTKDEVLKAEELAIREMIGG